MIFVSYSHADEKWRKRFEIISKPLSRSEGIVFWSDKDLKAGEWEPQIQKAMQGAVAAVLLVSDGFLASDYIMHKELPYLLRARQERRLMIFWTLLEPCYLKAYPEIERFQAMTLGSLEPLSKLTDWEWKATMVKGCGMIDDFLKSLEEPVLNRSIHKKTFPQKSKVALLSKPARRNVEVLVYSPDKRWWRQAAIRAGATEATVHLGDSKTPKGTAFNVVALTAEKPLASRWFSNLPNHRTISKEFTLVRG